MIRVATLPLAGRRILVTRTREQSSRLAAALQQLGAEVLEVPTIRIAPPSSYEPLDRALTQLAGYHMLLVTSSNTARVLAARRLPPWPDQPFTVAIGSATADSLREAGLQVDHVPEEAVAESLLAAIVDRVEGRRILLARAETAREVLPNALRSTGAVVDVVHAYRTIVPEESREWLQAIFAESAPDAVTFTSSSTVRNFLALLGNEAGLRALAQSPACSIGPVTSRTLREYGIEPASEASPHDVDGMVASVHALLAR